MPIEKRNVSYKTALGLDSDPFSSALDQDQRFYYAFEAFEQRLTLLKRLVRGQDVLILVIGELGSGKTTLINRYLAVSDGAWKTCRIRTPSTADPKRRQLLKNLNNHRAYRLKDAGDPVIIIDDAHELTRFELQFLLQDALAPGSTRKVKRLVLVGESGLNATFSALAAKIAEETAVNKIYLPTISEEETGAYLRHRLAVAGLSGKSPFRASVVKKLHRRAGGLPGKLNAAAHGWLKKTYGHNNRGRGVFSRIAWRRRLLIGGAIVGACALGLGWILLTLDRDEPFPRTKHLAPTTRVVRVKIPPADRMIRPKSDIAAAPATIQKDRRPIIAAISEKKTPPVTIPPTPTVPTAKNDKPTAVKTAVPPKTTAVEKGDSQPTKTATATSSKAEPLKTKPSAAANNAVRKTDILREKWLLEQDPRHYTIQILAVRREKSLLKFIEETQLNNRGRVAYFRAKLKGRDWYRLLYGVYPSKKDAGTAMDNLPSNIRQMSPWIRRLAPIQRAIKENVSQ